MKPRPCFALSPAVVRRLSLAVCGLVALFLLAGSAIAQGTDDPAAEQRLLVLINQERANAGLSRLDWDERMARAARLHAQIMAQRDELSHQFPDEDPLVLRLRAQSVRSDHDGENIALNGDVESAHVALMGSPLHRANILGPSFNAAGIGVIRAGELIYIAEDFAHVMPDYSDFEADAVVQQAISDFARARGMPIPKRKPRTQLVQLACDMAQGDKIDAKAARSIPGSTSAVAWTATDLRQLPPGLRSILSQPLTGPYSLGVCYASSSGNPGGVYWLLFVTY
ncbi:MAG TPA: CAP domain-containing protein [Candidatus Methylomirabilis sp.]|nr:CAP domain-containing protein [Candidatus Methylomirabilis sp.]